MTEIQIYNPDGTSWGIVPITEGAKHEEELMKTDSVTLSWKSTESVCIPMGSYVAYKGVVYKSLEPYYPQAKDSIEYQYQPVFVSEIFMLSKIPFLLYTNDGKRDLVEADWNFTGRGQDLVSTLFSSIKRSIGVDYVFDISSDIEASLSLSFSNVDILTALNSIASAWGCEWWTDWQTGMSTARIIHFGKKCVHNATDINPYRLTAGQNITMPNSNQKATYFNRFYIFGSTRNIPQDYEGAQATHVINKRLTLNPSKFPNGYIDLPVFDADGNATWDETNKRYITDLTDSDQRFTKVMYFDDIYPKSNCVVSEVKKVMRLVRDSEQKPIEIGTWKSTDAEVRAGYVKAGDVKYDFWYLYVIKLKYQNDRGEYVDFRMDKSTYSPKDNPSGQMIKGLELSLHFNSGSLEGREFKAAYYNETDKHPFRSEDERFSALNFETTGGEFEIVRTEDNTIILPNSGIEPSKGTSADEDGDKVVVFNIRMPEEYYYTAYNELEERAIEYIYDETKDANQYVVKSNPIAFAENVPNLHLGRHITLNIGGRDIDTRVTKLVTNLDRDYEQEITMSKALSKGTINTLLTTIESTAQSVVDVEVMDNTERKLAKQQMMSAIREMKDSMFDTDGYFTAPISPTTIDTMMLSVGATSTNFQLEGILFQPNYAPNTTTPANHNRFNVQSTNGKLIHYGIDIESDSPREWNMSGGDVEWFANGVKTTNPSNNSSFYLYAKCSVTGEGGVFLLDTKQRKYNSDSDYYYFLVGVLSKATTLNTYTSRILGTTYGITTINGNTIKTGRIQSVDGLTFFDLNKGEIGGNIKFTAEQGSDNFALINSIVSGNDDVKSAKESADEASGKVATLDYLKKALVDGQTIVSGGLVQTNIIMLGYYDQSKVLHVMTGSNGLYNPEAKGGGVASWWGGNMVDGYADGEEGEFAEDGAMALIRFDGTGYFAKGAIWWTADGNLHADPLSFFVGESSVGALLKAFQLFYHTIGSKTIRLDYIKPLAPFIGLELANEATDEAKKARIYVDANGNLVFDCNIVSKKNIIAYGAEGADVQTIQQIVEDLVEPNPTDAPTEDMATIKINGVVYNVNGGGGSGVASIELSLNQTDYKMQVSITDNKGETITSNVIDFPIESVVVGGSYDATNKNIVLTLKNGSQVTFSVADLVSGLASTTYVDNAVSGITKASLGLGNVDNTSDANKPISTATQTALNGKLSLSGGTMTGVLGLLYLFRDTNNTKTGVGGGIQGDSAIIGIRTDGTVYRPHILSEDGSMIFGVSEWNSQKWARIGCDADGKIKISSLKTGSVPFVLCANGDVGVGTENPSYRLHVVGGSVYSDTAMRVANNKPFASKTSNGTDVNLLSISSSDLISVGLSTCNIDVNGSRIRLYNSSTQMITINGGNLTATGDITAYSDARLKSDIQDLEYRGSLTPKTYIKDGKKSIGFVAQEVRKLYPELVQGEEKEDEYLSLNYGAITAVLAAENKELKKKVESLEDRIAKLEELLSSILSPNNEKNGEDSIMLC